jgi:3-hydroxyisobutyrate dehydrogenase-like beta-hydroxyacid dehydrogenase
MPDTVGVVGLGRMGLPIAQNISNAGYDVYGYDLRSEPIEELEVDGGIGVDSPAELAEPCNIVLIVVQNAEQVRETLFGENGLCAVNEPEFTAVISATVAPEAVHDINEEIPSSVTLVDAPLCRGDDAAIAGNLLVLAGGPADAFNPVREVFEATADPNDIYHMGELGLGEVAKTANNVLLWSALVADVEVFELCETYGMDIDKLTNALAKSSGTNWGVNNWTERYPRQIPWAHKDMRIALDMAEGQGVTMPSAGLLREQVRELQAAWESE